MPDDSERLTPGQPEDLQRDVEFALRQHARGHFRFKKHDDAAPASIAARVVAYLRLANWRFFRGPPAAPMKTPDMTPAHLKDNSPDSTG